MGEQLVNRRLAYVAVSRGRHDAQIYTNDKAHLAGMLSRDVAHRSAMEPSLNPASSVEQIDRSVSRNHQAQPTIAQGLEREIRPSLFYLSTVLDGVQGPLAMPGGVAALDAA